MTDSYVAAWVTDLGERVRDTDLETLATGFDAGGGDDLPRIRVEHRDEDTLGHLVRLERHYTFTENGETRKRRLRAVGRDRGRRGRRRGPVRQRTVITRDHRGTLPQLAVLAREC